MMLRLTKPWFSQCEHNAVREVLDGGWLAEGERTKQLEHDLARFVGAKHAVAVSNCTVALTLALKAHKTKGEVSIPDFTHPATALAVQAAGCEPVLHDVSLDSYNADAVDVPVSWAGNPLKEVFGDQIQEKFPIVEDAACSLGAGNTGKHWTTCFSFHPRKLITCGEGGAVTTNNLWVADRIRFLKNFGEGGGNYKLDDLRAAILIEQLKRLPKIIARRREMAHVYTELLEGRTDIISPEQSDGHVYQTYAVRLADANLGKVIEKLKVKGIETQFGTYALHLLPQFSKLRRFNELKNSALLARSLLALPMAYDLTEEDQKRVIYELAQACHS